MTEEPSPTGSTGHLPDSHAVKRLVDEAYDRFKMVESGKVADYIPALAQVPHDLFVICVVGANGNVHTAGDAEYEFSIQSVSKPFVFALICHATVSYTHLRAHET